MVVYIRSYSLYLSLSFIRIFFIIYFIRYPLAKRRAYLQQLNQDKTRYASTSPFISHGKRREKNIRSSLEKIFSFGSDLFSTKHRSIFIAFRLRFPWTPSSEVDRSFFIQGRTGENQALPKLQVLYYINTHKNGISIFRFPVVPPPSPHISNHKCEFW